MYTGSFSLTKQSICSSFISLIGFSEVLSRSFCRNVDALYMFKFNFSFHRHFLPDLLRANEAKGHKGCRLLVLVLLISMPWEALCSQVAVDK